MRVVTVRYTVNPGHVEENAALVRAVYAELAEVRPAGFRYATFLEPDGHTFRHIAIAEGDLVQLPELETFRRFQAELGDRCSRPPELTKLEEVGSYRFAPAPPD